MKNSNSKKDSHIKRHTGGNKKEEQSGLTKFFGRFSAAVTRATGGVYAFIVAIVVVIVWAATGPIFKYSDTWQLVINTGTTIITFLMVFIIQHSQNKDTVAVQLKVNELIAASQASNKLIDVEDLDDEDLEKLKNFYANFSSLSKKESKIKYILLRKKKMMLKMLTQVKEKQANKLFSRLYISFPHILFQLFIYRILNFKSKSIQ